MRLVDDWHWLWRKAWSVLMLIALLKQIAAPYLLRLIIAGLITSAIGGGFFSKISL
jgi:hypothetical protein